MQRSRNLIRRYSIEYSNDINMMNATNIKHTVRITINEIFRMNW